MLCLRSRSIVGDPVFEYDFRIDPPKNTLLKDICMTFSRLACAGFCVALCLAGLANAQEKKKGEPAAKSPGKSEYFPLAVGSKWVYETNEGPVTTEITKHEEIGRAMCARLEATTADNKKTSEYLRITADGIYRHQASDQNITPPLRFLKLPFKVGDSWTVESKVLGKTLKGTFKVSTSAEESVLGKTYKNVVVCTSDDFTVDGQKLTHTYYFAKDVGIIKQVVNFAGQEIKLELKKYTPGAE